MSQAAAPKTPSATGGFREELVQVWHQVPNKPLFLILFGAWLGLFHFLGNSTLGYVETPSLFGWLSWVYEVTPDESHGQLIPFVVIGLMWWKRAELLMVPKKVWLPALAILILAMGVHLLGFLIQQARVSLLGFFLGLYGLMGLAWGPKFMKAAFFPFFLFGFCMPLGNSAEAITFPLRILVTKLSVFIANDILGIEVIRDGSRIFNPALTFQFDVAPACSGIRSLITLLALTTIYGFVTFRKNWKRVTVAALAVPLAVLGNTVRITTVIIVGEAFGQDAGAAIEQKLGFITFAVALVAIFAIGYFFGEDKPPGDSNSKPAETTNPLDESSKPSSSPAA